jgi:hypothetical protein
LASTARLWFDLKGIVMRPARHTRSACAALAAGCFALAASAPAQAIVLFSETPFYTVTVSQPGSDFGIVLNNAQTTRFSTATPFLLEVGPSQSASVILKTSARFDAKPGYILTGMTVSGAAPSEAWEGGYSVGGTWTALTAGSAADASGTFPTIFNVTWNQNTEGAFPPATVGLPSPTLFFTANLNLSVGGAADCGRAVCARTGDPHVRVDLSWAAAPIPEPGTWALMSGGLVLLAGIGLRRSRDIGRT